MRVPSCANSLSTTWGRSSSNIGGAFSTYALEDMVVADNRIHHGVAWPSPRPAGRQAVDQLPAEAQLNDPGDHWQSRTGIGP